MCAAEIRSKEIIQAGDSNLVRFNCPNCRKEQFQGFPLLSCSDCKHDLAGYAIDLSGRHRLLSGTRRKKGALRKRDVQTMLEEQGYKCAYCTADLRDREYHVEHIVPVSVGGSNNLYNLCVSCAPCNLKAGAKAFSSFEAKRQYILGRRCV